MPLRQVSADWETHRIEVLSKLDRLIDVTQAVANNLLSLEQQVKNLQLIIDNHSLQIAALEHDAVVQWAESQQESESESE